MRYSFAKWNTSLWWHSSQIYVSIYLYSKSNENKTAFSLLKANKWVIVALSIVPFVSVVFLVVVLAVVLTRTSTTPAGIQWSDICRLRTFILFLYETEYKANHKKSIFVTPNNLEAQAYAEVTWHTIFRHEKTHFHSKTTVMYFLLWEKLSRISDSNWMTFVHSKVSLCSRRHRQWSHFSEVADIKVCCRGPWLFCIQKFFAHSDEFLKHNPHLKNDFYRVWERMWLFLPSTSTPF